MTLSRIPISRVRQCPFPSRWTSYSSITGLLRHNQGQSLSLWRRSVSTTSSGATPDKPFYITTPIFYVNAPAHVGHLYTMVIADVIKKWQILKGRKTILCTGVDEHGLKVQKAAEANSISPKTFCDSGAENFQNLAKAGNIDYDHFVRTSSEDHRDVVQYVWNALYDSGFIYRAQHEGWYSVSDETFYPENQTQPTIDPRTGRKFRSSIETGKEVEWASEENYHFRLSEFRDILLTHYRKNPGFITPSDRMNNLYREIENGLQDLSISRPAERLTWGIPVPHDETQTIYVWMDALMNYIAKTGYPWQPGKEMEGGWPPDFQVIGKDITRFHCIYWPAFLAALGVALPSRILTHGHWTLGRKKMSKSDGNVVNPFFALDRFGVDVVRFFMIHDGGVGYDPEYNNDLIISLYKDVLQSVFGNLTARLVKSQLWDVRRAVLYRDELMVSSKALATKLAFAALSADGSESEYGAAADSLDPFDIAQVQMIELITGTAHKAVRCMDAGESREALEAVVAMLREIGKYFHNSAPWAYIPKPGSLKGKVAASNIVGTTSEYTRATGETSDIPTKDLQRLHTILYLTAEALRIAGIVIQPTMPGKAKELLDMLGVPDANRGVGYVKLFADSEYGLSFVPTKGKTNAILFPALVSDE